MEAFKVAALGTFPKKVSQFVQGGFIFYKTSGNRLGKPIPLPHLP
jgi:hypothetical protein